MFSPSKKLVPFIKIKKQRTVKIIDTYFIFNKLFKESILKSTIFRLLKNEGLCLGPSSGINVAGSIQMAKELGPGHTIVTILCDYGTRYSSKIFNAKFLESKNLPVPDWLI